MVHGDSGTAGAIQHALRQQRRTQLLSLAADSVRPEGQKLRRQKEEQRLASRAQESKWLIHSGRWREGPLRTNVSAQ
jgi:hypothetical protein